ncbi:MAG TPA: hypothetical protein VH684_16875 [Xanthobacteraceae bacterium]
MLADSKVAGRILEEGSCFGRLSYGDVRSPKLSECPALRHTAAATGAAF